MYFIYNQIWNGNAIATLKKLIYFNWRIITLQYSDGFFHILTWISHIATLFTTFYAFRYPSVCQLLSRVQLFVTSWTAAHQAPLSIGFSRQEYWSGLPVPSSGDLPNPGIEPRSPHCRQILYHLSHHRYLIKQYRYLIKQYRYLINNIGT